VHRRFAVALIAALASSPASAVSQGTIAIRNVTVIPMTGPATIVNQTVIVRDGRDGLSRVANLAYDLLVALGNARREGVTK